MILLFYERGRPETGRPFPVPSDAGDAARSQ